MSKKATYIYADVDNIWRARQEYSASVGHGWCREDVEVRVIGSDDEWSPLSDLDTETAAKVIDRIDGAFYEFKTGEDQV